MIQHQSATVLFSVSRNSPFLQGLSVLLHFSRAPFPPWQRGGGNKKCVLSRLVWEILWGLSSIFCKVSLCSLFAFIYLAVCLFVCLWVLSWYDFFFHRWSRTGILSQAWEVSFSKHIRKEVCFAAAGKMIHCLTLQRVIQYHTGQGAGCPTCKISHLLLLHWRGRELVSIAPSTL